MERNYTLTIKIDELSEGSASPIADDKGSATPGTQQQGLLNKDQAKMFATGFAAYKTVKSFAVQSINYEVSLVSLKTGSQELQERANFTNQVIQKGVGIMETVAAGALIGGLPGALIGLAVGTAHTLIDIGQKQNTINLQNSLESETLQRNIIRAGARGSRNE